MPSRAKRDATLEAIAVDARLVPQPSTATAGEYCHVRQYASAFREVAADNRALLPLLAAYLHQYGSAIEGPKLRWLKLELLDRGLRPTAWRYVCRHGVSLFRPIWAMSRAPDAWEAAKLYLRALDRAKLPPPPPPTVAYSWLRLFSEPGTDMFRMDDSLASIPPAVTRSVLYQADRWRGDMTRVRLDALLRALIWGEATRIWPDHAQRRAAWGWLNRQAASWEADMAIAFRDANDAWSISIKGFRSSGLSIEPLRTAHAMVRHAQLMRNCLDTEINACRKGLARYYAVWPETVARRPLAHVGLRLDTASQRWKLADCKGFANAPAVCAAWRIAHELEARFNDRAADAAQEQHVHRSHRRVA